MSPWAWTVNAPSLTAELHQGHTRLRALDVERQGLQETILRIEGAIVVLQELTQNRNGGQLKSPNVGSGCRQRHFPGTPKEQTS